MHKIFTVFFYWKESFTVKKFIIVNKIKMSSLTVLVASWVGVFWVPGWDTQKVSCLVSGPDLVTLCESPWPVLAQRYYVFLSILGLLTFQQKYKFFVSNFFFTVTCQQHVSNFWWPIIACPVQVYPSLYFFLGLAWLWLVPVLVEL